MVFEFQAATAENTGGRPPMASLELPSQGSRRAAFSFSPCPTRCEAEPRVSAAERWGSLLSRQERGSGVGTGRTSAHHPRPCL